MVILHSLIEILAMIKYGLLSILLMLSLTAAAKNPQVVFETSKGSFTVELYPEKAPKTVSNFLAYVNKGFYNDTIFHRVIKSFMIQGGGFTKAMEQKDTSSPIVNEADNGLHNEIGTIAMARTGDPNSATSQFFINTNDNQFLNYRGPDAASIGYCVFGRVIQGMETVFSIGESMTHYEKGHADVPIEQIVIQHVKQP